VTPQAAAVLELFRSKGAYLEGHFRLTSGLHSAEYWQSAKVLQHPEAAEKLGKLLAEELRAAGGGAAVVISPAIGGLIIGHEAARALSARHIFTERDPASGKMILRRGFEVTPGERAVVVEDVITTGGTTRDVIDVVRAAGGDVVAAGSIVDRSGGAVNLGVPRVALLTMRVEAHTPEDCPLCKQGIPAVKPGSRPV
jgi:orotate phosphoribosyltransferase